MIKEIQAPARLGKNKSKIKIFLAGSIEMGKAEDWQAKVVKSLSERIHTDRHSNVVILNPRRKDWDGSWEQKYENCQFNQQVNWELDNLEDADFIIFYFAPGTISPISLLELGKFAHSHECVVVCPEGYERKGNVDIFCEKFKIREVDTLEEAIVWVAAEIEYITIH